ncbi:hypothetical protein Salmuc_02966 [Salipiger mucosus DSM 16094]|uniref:Uncharacterized protein n=1 Tax=Salipiger mucosus DSM 16094 TaxID=1123237 RepID=S9R039_9RHOB|nr:hypothetical protein Salmuc_02966 [Salipiger mucosus DSM 16094]
MSVLHERGPLLLGQCVCICSRLCAIGLRCRTGATQKMRNGRPLGSSTEWI